MPYINYRNNDRQEEINRVRNTLTRYCHSKFSPERISRPLTMTSCEQSTLIFCRVSSNAFRVSSNFNNVDQYLIINIQFSCYWNISLSTPQCRRTELLFADTNEIPSSWNHDIKMKVFIFTHQQCNILQILCICDKMVFALEFLSLSVIFVSNCELIFLPNGLWYTHNSTIQLLIIHIPYSNTKAKLTKGRLK